MIYISSIDANCPHSTRFNHIVNPDTMFIIVIISRCVLSPLLIPLNENVSVRSGFTSMPP
jgi:hypothetical protein